MTNIIEMINRFVFRVIILGLNPKIYCMIRFLGESISTCWVCAEKHLKCSVSYSTINPYMEGTQASLEAQHFHFWFPTRKVHHHFHGFLN